MKPERDKPCQSALFADSRAHAAREPDAEGVLLAGPLAIPVALGRAGSAPTSAKATAGRRAGVSVRSGCGGGRIAHAAAHPAADASGSGRECWCEDPADRHYNRPIRRAAGEPGDRLGARTTSMT